MQQPLPWTIEDRSEVEVAYLLAEQYWGQGLATEAGLAIVHHGFERLGPERLVCLIDPGNQRSIRVAERVGMSLERQMDDAAGPFLLYAQSRPAA